IILLNHQSSVIREETYFQRAHSIFASCSLLRDLGAFCETSPSRALSESLRPQKIYFFVAAERSPHFTWSRGSDETASGPDGPHWLQRSTPSHAATRPSAG